jgi:hypothetical protein
MYIAHTPQAMREAAGKRTAIALKEIWAGIRLNGCHYS